MYRMGRMCMTERQQARVLSAWLTGLTVVTVVQLWCPGQMEPQSLVVTDEVGGGQEVVVSPSTPHDVVEVLLEGPLDAADNRLVAWLRQGGGDRIFPPSDLPYNITVDNTGGWRDSPVWKFYVKMINSYFGKKEEGFFVEAGALDGVLLSPTLALEQHLSWTGLLVEPRPDMFQQLLHKHRRAHAARFCLSDNSYPHKTSFWMSPDYVKESVAYSAVGSQLLNKVHPEQRETGNVVTVHCMPLLSLLKALDRTHIDLFVLDVEGVEWGVIDLFPFDKITVDMLAVERKYKGEDDREAFIHMIQSKGFTLTASLKEDFVFVRD
ncbi:uncharacterized protein [Panulirus ornatus]|uniref:uncharacterized protein n=1 Tax=Panulirus ornatus TaxID=150431 RepID=UPI003A879EB1